MAFKDAVVMNIIYEETENNCIKDDDVREINLEKFISGTIRNMVATGS